MNIEHNLSIEHIHTDRAERNLWRAFFDDYARQWMTGVLILTDLFSLFFAIFIALQIRHLSFNSLNPAYDQVFSLLPMIHIISFIGRGLYPGVGLHYADELRGTVNSVTTTFLIVVASTFLLQTSVIYSRLVLLFAWLLCLVITPVNRYLVRRFFISLDLWGEPVVVVGAPDRVFTLVEHFRLNRNYGLRTELTFCDTNDLNETNSRTYPVVSPVEIGEAAQRLNLHTILLATDDLNHIDAIVDRYRFVFERLILIKDQTGKYGLNTLQPLDFSTSLGLQVNNKLLSRWGQMLKRILDMVISIFALLFLAPVFGLIALLIKFDPTSPGRVFYRQRRLGKSGKIFSLLKFRTMYINAEYVLNTELVRDASLRKEWDCFQKLKNDPRITRTGKFLRKFSLDELPQLFNVLRGEMSLVGPRPIMLDQDVLYGQYFKDYVRVAPGMTGLWQVSGRNETSFARRAELDIEYIQRWSLWMDIYILFKTIKVVLWHKGAS